MDAKRIREIEKTPKAELARMHVANGCVYPSLAELMNWSKDDLVSAVIEDETRRPFCEGGC